MHQRLRPLRSARARLLVSLALAIALGAEASEIELVLDLVREAPSAEVEILWEEVSRSDDEGAPGQGVRVVEVPGPLLLDLEPGSVWQVSLRSERFWASPEIISVGDRPSAVRWQLWPTARVVGDVAVQQGEELPPSIDVRFETPPDAPAEIARSQVTCAIEQERYDCALPAAALDLRFRARGFISHYAWDVELPPGGQHRMGPILLRRGASIVGWVEMEDPETSFEDAVVTLSHQIASAIESEGASQKRRAISLEASVNPRGFFELVGVPEGLYAVNIDHPAYAPARYAPVQVLPNAEAELYPIQLYRALSLQLEIQPERPAISRQWGVQLFRKGETPGHLDLVAESASRLGFWSKSGLAPGGYVLRVTDGPDAVWFSEDLELPASVGTVFRQVELPVEELVGQVFLGDEPLAASLYFGAYHGSVRIPAESDAEGQFLALIPLEDTWTIDVYGKGTKISHRFQDVAPLPGGEGGRRWLELIIQDTFVEGVVLDDQDRPVEGARVRARGRRGGQIQRSGADGEFTLRGLLPGEYWIGAVGQNQRSRSALLQIEVEADEPPPLIELILRDNRGIEGQVVGPSGLGVVGAKVIGLIEQTAMAPVAFEIPDTETDVDGTFFLEIPEGTESVLLTALPPGFAARQVRVDSRSEDSVIIPVEPHGGTLRLHHGADLRPDQVRIFKSGLLPNHLFLSNWARLNGQTALPAGDYAVPMLDPGYYQVCADPGYRHQLSGRLTPELAGSCRGGIVPPYGELVLDLSDLGSDG